MILAKDKNSRVSGKQALAILLIQRGKSALLHKPIMKEAHSKMRNNGELKATFRAERPRRFDILQAKEATFLSVDGCSERVREFSMPGYQLKPSDKSKLNLSIKEHRGMVKKLNVMLRDFKESKGTRFRTLSVQWACFKAGRKN